MPITIGYQPVQALSAAAILAGQGQYAKWIAAQQQEAALQTQRLQAQSDMQRAQLSAEAQRQQASFGQQSSMADKEYGQRKEFAGIGHGYDLEKMDVQHGYRQDDMRADQENDLAKIKQSFENQKALQTQQYTGPDAFKVQKIQQQIKDLQSNPSFTDEEKAEGVKQLQTQLLGLHPETMPINLQDYFTKNSAQIEGLGTMIRTPDGKFHVIKPPSEGAAKADKFEDPAFINKIYDQTYQSMVGALQKGDPMPTEDEVAAETMKRINMLKRTMGRQLGEGQEFNPNMRSWSEEQMIAARDAQPGEMLKAAEGAFRPSQRGMPLGDTPQSDSKPVLFDDPIQKAYPPEVAQQINSQITSLTQQVIAAKKSGDKQAVSAAKQQLSAYIQQHMPEDTGAAAVAPPQAPIVPPPPVSGKPKSRTNSMTVKGRTISKEQ